MKKFLLMALSMVTVAALAITGTIAYLTSEDSDVNVMTTGNVQIEQLEQERDADGNLVDFTQWKPALPVVGNPAYAEEWVEINGVPCTMFDNNVFKNTVDKIISVKNTGRSDAYFRTIIAIEDPFTAPIVAVNTTTDPDKYGMYDGSAWFTVEIDGVTYSVKAFTHKASLKAGETSAPSLLQAYIASIATNEDCAKLGDTWDILALSQAVQVNGFKDAETALNEGFGELTEENLIKWFKGLKRPVMSKGYVVSSDEELADAITSGETELWLNPGTYHAPSAAKGKTLTINGTADSVLAIVPAGQGEANGQLDYNFDGSTVTFNGITIQTNNQTYAGYARLTGIYNQCTFNGHYCLQRDSEFTGCILNVTGDQYNIWTWGAPNVSFTGCTFNTDGKALLVYNLSCNVTVDGCTFNDSGVISGKAAIEACAGDYGAIVYHNIVVNKTTVNGFDANNSTSALWGNKNSLSQDYLNVVVDGVDVY